MNHWRGELAGTPFILAGWEVFVVGSLFGWVLRADAGTYRFQRAYIEVPKKSGKTMLSACVAILKAFFDGESGAEVYSIATKYDQARLCWNEAREIIRKTPWLREKFSGTIMEAKGQENIYNRESSSKFEPLHANKDSADGVNPNAMIADEVHRYHDSELMNTVEKSMAARRNPLIVEITTAGWNKNTICFKHHELSIRILEGATSNERWFTFIAGADPEDKKNWDDPKVWRKANVGWDISVRPEFIESQAKIAREIPSERNEFLRFHLNIWTEQAERWIDMERWHASGKGSMSYDELRGLECFGGLDLASNIDLCAFVLLFPVGDASEKEREFHLLRWFWCPGDGITERSKEDGNEYDQWAADGYITATDGDTADHRVIKRDILAAAEDFQIQQIAYDPHNSGNLPSELQEVLGTDEREVIVKHYQGFGNMAAPTKEMERLVSSGEWKHGDDPVLNWMASNVAVRRNEYGDMRIDKAKSTEKVDGMVAAAMALGTLMKFEKEPDQGPSVYDEENRGLFVF